MLLFSRFKRNNKGPEVKLQTADNFHHDRLQRTTRNETSTILYKVIGGTQYIKNIISICMEFSSEKYELNKGAWNPEVLSSFKTKH